ncbi:unnamed protein product, partial [Mesorhabditis belari]|uniref:Threonylcarbamoyl-AMP synthase n=1 Tax=Mesorhabditis belari TaxID=2138241 RepID=A0AAF3F4B7_9BILA
MPLSGLSKVLRLSSESIEEALEAACRILLNGGIVALPTDTIYGLTTTLENSNKLYALKRRSGAKPLGIFVSSWEEIKKIADSSIVDQELLSSLLPGPVTLLFERAAALPSFFNPGVSVVGVRVPKYHFVQELSKRVGVPLAQTSANISGDTSPLSIADFEHLIPLIDLVIDGGVLGNNTAPLGSTVVDLSRPGFFHIIRPGCAEKATCQTLLKNGLEETNGDETSKL